MKRCVAYVPGRAVVSANGEADSAVEKARRQKTKQPNSQVNPSDYLIKARYPLKSVESDVQNPNCQDEFMNARRVDYFAVANLRFDRHEALVTHRAQGREGNSVADVETRRVEHHDETRYRAVVVLEQSEKHVVWLNDKPDEQIGHCQISEQKVGRLSQTALPKNDERDQQIYCHGQGGANGVDHRCC